MSENSVLICFVKQYKNYNIGCENKLVHWCYLDKIKNYLSIFIM